MNILFPEIEVQLSGIDGNAHSILGVVLRAMKKAGVDQKDIAVFLEEAESGDYDHLLQTAMRTVTVN
jgi:hypothetical protein